MSMGLPMANYQAFKRLGNTVFASGIVAVNPTNAEVVERYDQLPPEARQSLKGIGYDTGQLSVDVFEAPIVAQSWWILHRIQEIGRQAGAQPEQTARLVQYFRDLRHYPAYNRVRSLFYPSGVVSTVVEVNRFLPNDKVWVEVEATWLL